MCQGDVSLDAKTADGGSGMEASAKEGPVPIGALVLTVGQVAKMLQVPVETIKNLYRVRQLPGVMVGKHLRFKPCSVEAFVEGLKPVGD